MRASAVLTAVVSARLAVSAAIRSRDVPAEGVPITELESYPDLLTSTEAPADTSLAAAYATTANELTDGTPCRAVTLICTYCKLGALTGSHNFRGNDDQEGTTSALVTNKYLTYHRRSGNDAEW